MMKPVLLLAALCLAAVPAAAQDKAPQQDPGTTNRSGVEPAATEAKASKATRKFMKRAASGNTLEVETSRLALEKSRQQDIKAFAQTMIDDHTKVGNQMKETLQAAGLPAPPDEMTEKHQDTLNTLKEAGGDRFDTEYVAVQIKAHEEAVALFSDYGKAGDNQPLKQFAETTLPSLKHHQKMAEELKSKITTGSATQ